MPKEVTEDEPKRTIVTIRLTPTELERAHHVAEHHGLNLASAVRMLLTREHRSIGLAEKDGGR